MSAYSDIHRALTRGRPLRPAEAEQLLAALRAESGAEFADVLERELSGQFRRTDTDTYSSFRKKRASFAASMRIVNALRALARASRPTLPNQRNRSTS
ncbi:hypothetical protein ACFWN1_12530 [Streptomyces sp. NPDC058459]|uniref:hypothetical protein n=1 Tax=Streptomyces sp. NPDC058459 TaxID=3346508 RepID=UPI003645FC5A